MRVNICEVLGIDESKLAAPMGYGETTQEAIDNFKENGVAIVFTERIRGTDEQRQINRRSVERILGKQDWTPFDKMLEQEKLDEEKSKK